MYLIEADGFNYMGGDKGLQKKEDTPSAKNLEGLKNERRYPFREKPSRLSVPLLRWSNLEGLNFVDILFIVISRHWETTSMGK